MAECDIFLSLSLPEWRRLGTLLIENDFETLLRSHLSNVVNALLAMSLLPSISCKRNEKGGNTQYFIY